jgi:hypothetical protein
MRIPNSIIQYCKAHGFNLVVVKYHSTLQHYKIGYDIVKLVDGVWYTSAAFEPCSFRFNKNKWWLKQYLMNDKEETFSIHTYHKRVDAALKEMRTDLHIKFNPRYSAHINPKLEL